MRAPASKRALSSRSPGRFDLFIVLSAIIKDPMKQLTSGYELPYIRRSGSVTGESSRSKYFVAARELTRIRRLAGRYPVRLRWRPAAYFAPSCRSTTFTVISSNFRS